MRTRGYGCPYCRATKGEKRVLDFLTKHNVLSKTQHTFADCVYQKRLRFDNAVFHSNGSLGCLIEYDGEQHFRPVDFTSKTDGKEQFEVIKKRDRVKNEYCRKNKIPLVRISYKDYDNIEKILLKKLVRYGLM